MARDEAVGGQAARGRLVGVQPAEHPRVGAAVADIGDAQDIAELIVAARLSPLVPQRGPAGADEAAAGADELPYHPRLVGGQADRVGQDQHLIACERIWVERDDDVVGDVLLDQRPAGAEEVIVIAAPWVRAAVPDAGRLRVQHCHRSDRAAAEPGLALPQLLEDTSDALPHRLLHGPVWHHDIEEHDAGTVRRDGEGLAAQMVQRLHVGCVGMGARPGHDADLRRVAADGRGDAGAHTHVEVAAPEVHVRVDVVRLPAQRDRLSAHRHPAQDRILDANR